MARRRATGSPRRNARRFFLEELEGRALLTSLTVGPNVNITRAPGNQVESSISIDPNNNQRLFESDTFSTVGHYSTDGGATWLTSNTSALPNSLGDVQTAWDRFGNLFLTEFGNTSTLPIIVGLSTNGGASFSLLTTLPGTGYDQPSIAVGPGQTPGTGSVWVSVTNSSNVVVATGAPVTGLGAIGSFSALQSAPGPGGDFGSIAIGPSGQVLIDYQNNGSGEGPDTIKTNLDPNGLAAGGFNSNLVATSTNVGGFSFIPAQSGRSVDAEGNLAWDRSGGPFNGRVYLVYVDRPTTSSADTDIYVRYSDNDGATWSARTRVNDDTPGNGKSQFNPAIAVDQTTGEVAITWYDTRNSGAANNSAQVFGTASVNGGASFLPNVQISAGTSNASAVDAGFEFGDYDLMDFANGAFYRTWADNSNSTGNNPDGTTRLDIYTARVTVNTDVAPAITLQPADQTVTAGQTATFTAAASGSPAPTVQWYVNAGSGFVAIAGATDTTLTLTNVQTSQSGNLYEAVFTNSAGTATTDAATLTVTPGNTDVAPAITLQPADQTVTAGQTATFTAAASGSPAPTVQWYVNAGSGFVAIAGATDTTLTLTNVQTSQSGNLYEAVFTNSAGTATTDAATLTVAPVPAVVSVQVDIGTPQRSMVRSLDVTFNQVVTLDPGTFQLKTPAGVLPVTLSFTTSIVDGRTVAHITFSGAGILAGSLQDGRYTLTTLASGVQNGNDVGLASDSTFKFYRFFGDSNGDGLVDAIDYAAFRAAYLSGNAALYAIYDFNGDGVFSTADLQAFTNNFRKRQLS